MARKKPLRVAVSMCRRHPQSQHKDSVRALEWLIKRGVIQEEHEIFSEYTDGMSLIPWARNLNAAACLGRGADIIFIVDDDVWFRSEDVESAIASELPIVGLPVMLKTEDLRLRTLNYSVFPGDPFIDVEKDFRHIQRIGTGAMVVRAEVFRAMQKTRTQFQCDGFAALHPECSKQIKANCYDYFPCGPMEIDGTVHYIGEDYGFCIEASKVGYPTFQHNTSVTAHMVLNAADGYLCNMMELRHLAKNGLLPEGGVHNI